jgi:hypothetical protein
MIKYTTTYKNNKSSIRWFCSSQAHPADSDLMTRINSLLDKNKAFNKESKYELLKIEDNTLEQKRVSLNKVRMEEEKKAQGYIGQCIDHISVSQEDLQIINEKKAKARELVEMYETKLSSLEINSPDDIKNVLKISHLIDKARDKNTDDIIGHLETCMEKNVQSDDLIWLRRAFAIRNAKRKEVIEENDKLYLEEKKLMDKFAEAMAEKNAATTDKLAEAVTEKNSATTDNRSLTEDFADPNLEQPSYMDPED